MRKIIKAASIILCLLVVTMGSSCSKDMPNINEEKKNIAIIGGMNSGYYWGSVKRGVETASREFNVNIEYSAPNEEDDTVGQIKLVNQALEKKVDALILSPGDYRELVSVTEKAYEMKIPVIIIDSQINTDKIQSYIGTDNLEAGKKAGNMAVELAGEDSKIAIINSAIGSQKAKEREEGVISIILKYPNMKVAGKEYCLSDSKRAYNFTKEIILGQRDINTIIALNSTASEGAAQAIDEMNMQEKVKLIAFDSTIQEIEFLEKGVIKAAVIQNPFSMGYLGVKNAVEAIKGKKIPKNIDTGSKLIDKSNMELPENQKLLFPFVK
jgi:ribose transport system substrate-binding protein